MIRKKKYTRKYTKKKKTHKPKRKYKKKKAKRKYTKKRKYKKRVKKGGSKFEPKNVNELVEKLNQYNISIDNWNTRSGNKTVKQLFKEIQHGDSTLIESSNKLFRSVRVVNVIILSDDEQYRLIEKSHLNKNRELVKERGNNVLSEKMETDENILDAISRGIREELGEKYSENIVFLDKERTNVKNMEKSSYSYPGLNALYTFYEKTVKIPLLTQEFPPPIPFETEELNNDGTFKRYIVWNWDLNN